MGMFDDLIPSVATGMPGGATPDVVPAKDGKPTKPDVGRGAALARGVGQGVTVGLGDELLGASIASGIPEAIAGLTGEDRNAFVRVLGKVIEKPATLASPSIGALRLLYEQLTGKGEATGRYEEVRDIERERNKTAQEQYPGTYLTGQIAGSLAVPVPGGAATLPARIGRGAATGGVVGGVTGFGEGEGLGGSVTQGASGAVIGGGVGGAAAPVVEGVVQGGRALAQPVINAFRGAVNPELEASRRVIGAIDRDVRASPTGTPGLTPQEFMANSGPGGPAAIMDMGGDLTRRLADSAAITSPEGRTALNQVIEPRFEGQNSRVTGWLKNTFNFPNAFAQRTAIDAQEKTVNKVRYDKAFATHPEPMWDEALAGLAQDPMVQSAIRRASAAVHSERTVEGFRPLNNPFTFEQSSGRLMLRQDQNGKVTYPDLQFWNAVKKELDANGSREAQSFAKSLRNHLDELTRDPKTGVSVYKEAREGAMGFFQAENALEAGENFVKLKLGNREARAQLAKMTPQQRQLFQDGFVSRYIEELNTVSDKRSILNKISDAPEAKEKLSMVLGQHRANELEAMLRVEGILDLPRQAIKGNSWTAQRLYDLGLAGGGIGVGVGGYNTDPTQMTYGAVLAAISTGGKKIDQRVAQRVAQLLASNDPARLNLGITLVARSERMLENLRSTDRRIASAGAQQTSGLGPSIQGPVAGRAEGEQPQSVGESYQ